MMPTWKSFSFLYFCLILSSSNLFGQDTLVLIDRKPILISSSRVENDYVYYVKAGRKREKKIEQDKVYSHRSKGKPDQIYYKQDTLENNWYTAEQMAFYINGQVDARNGYLKQARKTGSGGMMFGFAGAAAGMFYGPLFVIGYTAWKGYTLPKFTAENGYNQAYIDNPYYKEGFGTTAKRMVTKRSAAGSAAGYILGVVTLTLVLN